jgi:stage III sporulation protein AB
VIYKSLGACLVVVSCGAYGYYAAVRQQKELQILRQFLYVLQRMECELNYRLPALADLCMSVAESVTGVLRLTLINLASELNTQILPDATSCLQKVLSEVNVSPKIRRLLERLAQSLGNFDADGQIKGICALQNETEQMLNLMACNQDMRLRSFRTLSLCAGAAVALLLI